MPFILHLPTMFQRSWSGEVPTSQDEASLSFADGRRVPRQKVVDLSELLNAGGINGECFVQYGWEQAPPDNFPRLAKAALAAEVEGSLPRLVLFAVDIDHEAHTTPKEGWTEEVLANISAEWRKAMSWYRTPNGLRLLFRPAQSVALDEAQSYLTQAHEELIAQGIPSDQGTRDWTRLFKIPRADRPDLAKDIDLSRPRLQWHPTELTKEDSVELGSIVHRDLNTLEAVATATKITKTHLKPLMAYDARLAENILSKSLQPPVGERHATFLRAAIKVCRAYETNDPMEPFRILKDCAIATGKRVDELASICKWAAAHYEGTRQVEEEERKDLLHEAAHHMRCPVEVVRSRLVVDVYPEFFVWDENENKYSRAHKNQRQLLNAIDKHCPVLAGYQAEAGHVFRGMTSCAQKVVYTYLDNRAGFYEDTGAIVVRVCEQDKHLIPKRSREVEEWLNVLFEGPHLDRVLDWLAAAPRLDKPVCALYVHAEPSVGKSLFALSLARLWSRESSYCNYAELTDNFNESLVESPLIWADEKAETGSKGAGGESDSSVFRRMIGNSSFKVNAKFKTPATVEGYPRILITANNPDALGIREDLDTSDIEAIKIRIGYVRANKAAEGWLTKRAQELGFNSAPDMVDSWKTDGIFAQHVLWLAETRRIKHGKRFLVEGWDSALTQALPTTVGSTGILVDAIIEAMTSEHYKQIFSIRWFDGFIFVSNPLLAGEWEDIMPGERLPGNTGRLKALKSMAEGEARTLDVNIPGRARAQKYYWAIPAGMIAQVALQRKLVEDPKMILDKANRLSEDEASTERHHNEVVLDIPQQRK